MLSDQDLLNLNSRGFIPGPLETEELFLKRVILTEKLCKDPEKFFEGQSIPFSIKEKIKPSRLNWTKSSLMRLFDIAPDVLPAFYSSQGLTFFQGAATWLWEREGLTLPVLEIRHRLKRGVYLGIYKLDEILSHEAVHAARIAFNESQFEEFFAYFTSSSCFRKIFGPIIRSLKEVVFFGTTLIAALFFQFITFFVNISFFTFLSLFFYFSSVIYLCCGLIRLFMSRLIFNRAYNKLYALLQKKTLAFLFRLTDKEIKTFSKMRREEVQLYIKGKSTSSLRWRLLSKAYFNKLNYP